MSYLVGRALARIALSIGGQGILELPDSLPARVARQIVMGAHEYSGQLVAIATTELRNDLSTGLPDAATRNFYALAGYRQDNFLAIVYASDNKGKSSFTTAMKPLLASSFPMAPLRPDQGGAAGLHDLQDALVAELVDRNPSLQDGREAARSAVGRVSTFLSEVHLKVAGCGSPDPRADWWLHLCHWMDSLDSALAAGFEFSSDDLDRLVFASAGLPAPDANGRYARLDADEYVSILLERWKDPAAIVRELERITLIYNGQNGATDLKRLPWADEFSAAAATLPSASLVCSVALAGSGAIGQVTKHLQQKRLQGWMRLPGEEFRNFQSASAGLRFYLRGNELPMPWKGASQVLAATSDQGGNDDGFAVEGFGVLLPWRGEPGASSPPLEALEGLEFEAQAGANFEFEPTGAEARATGLLVRGVAKIRCSPKRPGLLRVAVKVRGAAAGLGLADDGQATLFVVAPNECMVAARPAGPHRRSAERFVFAGDVAVPLELPQPGRYEFCIVAFRSAGQCNVSVGGQEALRGWPGFPEVPWFFQLESAISSDAAITIDQTEVVALQISEPSGTELSPVRACALGAAPNLKKRAADSIFAELEAQLGRCLSLAATGAPISLGVVLATSDAADSQLRQRPDGSLVSTQLADAADCEPGLPTGDLLNSAEYRALVGAYLDLNLPNQIEHLEGVHDSSGLTISRLVLDFIDEPKIEALLDRYVELVKAWGNGQDSNAFWARHPFSIVVFPHAQGFRQPEAVLLSPLHPVRLAWMWWIQFAATQEQQAGKDGEPLRVLQLIDPEAFPAVTSFLDDAGHVRGFVPVPVDPSPQGLYLGWHAFVSVSGTGPTKVPEWLSGSRFPVAGLSGLASSSVNAAISDFLRVNPHVQTLDISLSSPQPTSRSTNIDQGILDIIGDLASGRMGNSFVRSVKVRDSSNRLGVPPSLGTLRDDLALASNWFGVDWSPRESGDQAAPNICFVEGTAAVCTVLPRGTAATRMPPIPLRRFPRYEHPDATSLVIDYSLDVGSADAFSGAIKAIETPGDGRPLAVRIKPNLGALQTNARWIVVGSHGVDPTTLARTAPASMHADRMLWDWRPAAPLSSIRSAKSALAQPYSVLAKIPKALSASVARRVAEITGLAGDELEKRVRQVVATLASRAVGLNTLLAIGHHQATGALGFFFSLQLLTRWMSDAPEGELRMVIPIDAVDPLLRSIGRDAGETSRRADLLALSITSSAEGTSVSACPVEIKHYGLASGENAQPFPGKDSKALLKHRDQLAQYHQHLVAVQDRFMGDSRGSSVLPQQLAALLECGMQLAAGTNEHAGRTYQSAIADVLNGRSSFEIRPGLLMWFQPRAALNGSPAELFTLLSPQEHQDRLLPECGFLAVDPCPHATSLWNGDEIQPATKALEWAFSKQAEEYRRTGEGVAGAEGGVSTAIPPSPQLEAASQPAGNEAAGAGTAAEQKRRLSPAELEARYGLILRAFDEFKVKVRRPEDGTTPYREGPSFVEYAVIPGKGVQVKQVLAQLENIKLRLGLEEHLEIGSRTHLGRVLLSVPKSDKDRYYVDAESMWRRWQRPSMGFHVPLGEDIVGDILSINFADSNSPHLLIAGVTGGGKSEALLTLLKGAATFYSESELRLKLVDPKGTELVPLKGLPHLDGDIAWNAEQANEILKSCVEEMERRYAVFSALGVNNVDDYVAKSGTAMPRWLVVLDEYADLTSDDGDRKQIEQWVKRLSAKARACGIHLVVSTQKPVVKVINTVIKGNLPAAVALRCNTGIESRVVLDESGAETLTGKGDALLKVGAAVKRLQFARWVHAHS